jgi:hypothetical protein
MLKSIDSSALQTVLHLDEKIDAPVTKGQLLGTMDIRMADQTIATVNLVAAESLQRSPWLSFCRGVRNFFTSAGFWLTVLTLLIGFIAWMFLMRYINRKRRRRRRISRSASVPRSSGSRSSVRKSSNYRGPSTRSTSTSTRRKTPARSNRRRTKK